MIKTYMQQQPNAWVGSISDSRKISRVPELLMNIAVELPRSFLTYYTPVEMCPSCVFAFATFLSTYKGSW